MFPTRSWQREMSLLLVPVLSTDTDLDMMDNKAGGDETHGKNDTNGVQQTLANLPSEKINDC